MLYIAVDVTRLLFGTTQGNWFICVVMDYFTKWPEVATVVLVLVDQFFTCFGMLGELHPD